MREVLTLGVPVDDDDDDDQAELSLTRDRVARVLAMLEAKHGGLNAEETKARGARALRLYGAGAAPKKFARLAAQQVNGVLRDQYRFAGAGQTGRTSSKAARIRNLTRDVIGGDDGAAEASLVDAIADGCSHAGPCGSSPTDVPVARDLALLVRPALVAAPGKVLVGQTGRRSRRASCRGSLLRPMPSGCSMSFALTIVIPTRPDIYMAAAADILRKNDPSGITKAERSIGKVAVFALGFGGSVGALQRMALAYRIHLEDAEARRIVEAWRAANAWAPEFWGAHRDGESFGLWGAAMSAWEIPGQVPAGRIAFVYHADYLGGTLFMALPLRAADLSAARVARGRGPRSRRHADRQKRRRSSRRARGRAKLWHGTLAENATQAVAADLLRHAVARIETNPELAFMPLRMTTHDEILVEVDEARAMEAKAILRREMLTLPKWAVGLPLQSEESVCSYYSKSKAALQ